MAATLLLGLWLVGGNGCRRADAPVAGIAEPAADQCLLTLDVTGMTCDEACTPRVRKALGGVAGVRGVEVDFPTMRAKVLAEASLCAPERHAELGKALVDAGYGGKVVTVTRAQPAK